MQQRDVTKSSTGAKTSERAHVRCVQCGEVLDAKRIKAMTGSLLCAECAFDKVPCTD